MTTKLSLIIPAYNAEKYIVETLESITKQLTDEVEVIVVNDGSTDSTLSKLKTCFAGHIESNQLKLINQSNAGVSVARNSGIAVAEGEYIGFVDADDYLMPDYVETILRELGENKDRPDIIEFGYKVFKQSFTETAVAATQYSNQMFGLHQCQKVLNHVHAKASWYPWTRIFRRKLFINKCFPKGVRFCEDLMIIPALYEDAHTILVLKQALYAYRFTDSSATFNIRPDYFENLLAFYQRIPVSNELRFGYLRFAVANAIYSCNMKSGFKLQMPEFILKDLQKLRLNPRIYIDLNLKKILTLCYPNIYNRIKKINRL